MDGKLELVSVDNNQQMQRGKLSEHIREIDLNYANVNTRQMVNQYDQIAQNSTFTHKDGSIGTSVDILLGYQ